MKSFEERTEAIISRSQAKIAKRKRIRRWVSATCVPLALAVCVFGWWMGAGGIRADSAPEANGMMQEIAMDAELNYGMENSMLESPASSGRVIVAVKLVSNGRVQVSTSQVLFQALEKAFSQSIPANESSENPADSEKEGPIYNFVGDPIEDECYVLTVVYQNGDQAQYTLRGTQLTSADGKETYILSEEAALQLQQLKEELNALQDEYDNIQEVTP